MFNQHSDITFCLTSCGRLELLKKTLDSFLPSNAHNIAEAIIIEDANSSEIKEWLSEAYPQIKLIMNEEKLGHLRSVDRLYQHVSTEFIFHCEDDWLFDGRSILEECKKILINTEGAHEVVVRDYSDIPWDEHMVFDEVQGTSYAYRRPETTEWGAFTFNPSLIRHSLWQSYGPFADFVTEYNINNKMKADGKNMLFLNPGSCHHIGAADHIDDPFQPGRRRRGFLERMARSISKRRAKFRKKLLG